MSVHRTPTGKHIVRWREGRKNRSQTFDRRSDANAFDAEQRRRRQLGGVIPASKDSPPFDELAIEWLRKRERAGRSEATLRNDIGNLDRHILPSLGHLPVNMFSVRGLDAWQAERVQAGVPPNTVNRSGWLIGSVLDYAIKRGYLDHNPARHLDTLQHRSRKGQGITPEKVEELREWFLARDRLGDATLISTLAYVGTRPAEALAMRHDDVDLGTRRAYLHAHLAEGKIVEGLKAGSDGRPITLPRAAASDLAQWKLAHPNETLIWPNRKGEPWSSAQLTDWRSRYFRPACEAAGLGDFKLYWLRHTAASLRIKAGWPITEIAQQLGHSPTETLKTYAHVIGETKGAPAQDLDAMIGSARRDELEERRRASNG